MRKLLNICAFVCIGILISACENNQNTVKGVEKPEDLGNYTFELLKKLDNTSEATFVNSLTSVAEMKAFAEKQGDNITGVAKTYIDELTDEAYNQQISSDYSQLKKRGEQYKIAWNDIKFNDYKFNIKETDGLQSLYGNIMFKSEGNLYNVNISSIFMDDVYSLLRITRLTKRKL